MKQPSIYVPFSCAHKNLILYKHLQSNYYIHTFLIASVVIIIYLLTIILFFSWYVHSIPWPVAEALLFIRKREAIRSATYRQARQIWIGSGLRYRWKGFHWALIVERTSSPRKLKTHSPRQSLSAPPSHVYFLRSSISLVILNSVPHKTSPLLFLFRFSSGFPWKRTTNERTYRVRKDDRSN